MTPSMGIGLHLQLASEAPYLVPDSDDLSPAQALFTQTFIPSELARTTAQESVGSTRATQQSFSHRVRYHILPFPALAATGYIPRRIVI